MPPDNGRPFPSLPIVTPGPDPEPPRRSQGERYGALLYLGAGGLAVAVGLVVWFGWSAWALRGLWSEIYVLNDPARGEAERVAAAYALARGPAANQRQRWDLALRTGLPPLARYVVAESLTAEAAVPDPGGYGLSVARSEGWPGWLRLILARPIAYAAALDLPVARGPLAELRHGPDPTLALWADYALAEGDDGDPAAAADLRRAAADPGPDRGLAGLLLRALEATRLQDRLDALDAATLDLRIHHPAIAALWRGYAVRGGRLVPDPVSVPELRTIPPIGDHPPGGRSRSEPTPTPNPNRP